jgi:hypothetical protein
MRFIALFLAASPTLCQPDPHCLVWLPGSSGCSLCNESLVEPLTGRCRPITHGRIPNCRAYSIIDDVPYCTECHWGFYREMYTNECKKCGIEHCAICNDSRCFACVNGLDLSPDHKTCLASSKCPIEHCDIFYRDSLGQSCKQCAPGFVVWMDETRQCVPGPSQCLLMDPFTPDRCYMCRSGFAMDLGGACTIFVPSRSHRWLYWLLVPLTVVVLALLVHRTYGKQLFEAANPTKERLIPRPAPNE